MHKAQNRLQVPVPNIQLPVPKKEALETSDVDSSSSSSSSSSTIKVPIFSHLCAFDTQNSLQTVHKQSFFARKRCLHRRGAVDAHRCWRRGKMVQGTMLAWGGSSCQRKRKIPMLAKKKEITMLAWGEALASKEKEKDASESAIYSLCCILHI